MVVVLVVVVFVVMVVVVVCGGGGSSSSSSSCCCCYNINSLNCLQLPSNTTIYLVFSFPYCSSDMFRSFQPSPGHHTDT